MLKVITSNIKACKKNNFMNVLLFQKRNMMTTGTNNENKQTKVLITGSGGQIGVELSAALRNRFGKENVICSDVILPSVSSIQAEEPFYFPFLSAAAERNPLDAMELNTIGLHNILETSRENNCTVFVPSSIAAFGPTTPLDFTPDTTIQRPTTIYGIGKVYAEHMGEYYNLKHGVDFRSLRYPGLISYLAEPGGGTTDWAVHMFYSALRGEVYECFVNENTSLPMMYMPDSIRGTIKYIFDVPSEVLDQGKQRTFNIASFSLTPKKLHEAILKYIPSLKVAYKPDFRQQIADSWPKAFDDENARAKWGFKEDYNLDLMTKDMIVHLKEKLGTQVEIFNL